MKINQLFTQKVGTDLLIKLLSCFGLRNLQDKRMFSKCDMAQLNTVQLLSTLVPELEIFYLPCKAKIYLAGLTEKKALTVLKQVLRLHGYHLLSQEKNMNNKKVIFYRLISETEKQNSQHMKQFQVTNILTFS